MAPKGSSTDDLPDVFRARFAGLEEQHSTLRPGDYFHACFGCGPAHPDGLHVRCFKTPDGVESPVPGGPPGPGPGGIVAAYLDEILGGAAARAAGRPAITGELTVRYVKPVPIAT